MYLARLWNWIDDRDIDKHAVSVAILYGTKIITDWAMAFANSHADSPQAALIIAAVSAPYMALQAAAIKFHFDARAS